MAKTKALEDKRGERLYVLFTVEERARLDAAAKGIGLPPGTWARQLVLAEVAHREAEARSANPGEPLRERIEALETELSGLRARLAAAAVLAHGSHNDQEVPPPAAPPSAEELRRRILQEFELRVEAGSGFVPIWELRRSVGAIRGAARALFDETLRELQREDVLYLNKLNDPRGMSPEDLADCMLDPIRGRLGLVSRGSLRTAAPSAEAEGGSLDGFAAQVLEAARTAPSGRFGEDTVFIAHVWRRYRELHSAAPEAADLGAFKKRLVEANRAGLLHLVRADLVEAMDPADVEESEVKHFRARFHLLRT